ncbi:helix-turn-helix transcriptional regulator [Variovorax sp. J22R133]|uniref:helix-turn-helix transcriptional regulator n=1 Tax=Variovorax brevis TaxID=3053503 RepID=UPI002578A037|nr:helix-turn-helix transcriptional regulator [Variovorax sp. J22R133]MDM0111260.1 helix-turn-helix transcriptional regulator [Variovorax sp. J22R133]
MARVVETAMPMSQQLSHLLRTARAGLGISQLEMSLRLGVSQRHVNFVEMGRAHPGRALLLAWMREAGAEESLRNAALLHAGYALDAPGINGHSSATTQALAAMRQMLRVHHPNAGLIFDADWMTLDINPGARCLCDLLMPGVWSDLAESQQSLDMIAALAHPNGLLSRVREAARPAALLLAQLRAEQWARPSLKERVDRLEHALQSRYRLPTLQPAYSPGSPYLELHFETAHGTLGFMLLQTVYGLPHDVTVGSLRTELWLPVDSRTADTVRSLVDAPTGGD